MPGPGWPHFLSAIFTAGFFLLLTVQQYWLSAASGIGAIACILWWVWELDLPLKHKTADIGAGIIVPGYASGPRSHGWWAMVILLVVAGMIFLMLAFSYIFLWSQRTHLFPGPFANAPFASGLALTGAAFVLAVLMLSTYKRSPGLSATLSFFSVICSAAALWLDAAAWTESGVQPDASSHGALVYSFMSWQGLFLAVSAIMSLYAVARLAAGLFTKDRPATAESICIFQSYTAVQGALALLITRGFPMVA